MMLILFQLLCFSQEIVSCSYNRHTIFGTLCFCCFIFKGGDLGNQKTREKKFYIYCYYYYKQRANHPNYRPTFAYLNIIWNDMMMMIQANKQIIYKTFYCLMKTIKESMSTFGCSERVIALFCSLYSLCVVLALTVLIILNLFETHSAI